jgi:hypothetical protein
VHLSPINIGRGRSDHREKYFGATILVNVVDEIITAKVVAVTIPVAVDPKQPSVADVTFFCHSAIRYQGLITVRQFCKVPYSTQSRVIQYQQRWSAGFLFVVYPNVLFTAPVNLVYANDPLDQVATRACTLAPKDWKKIDITSMVS